MKDIFATHAHRIAFFGMVLLHAVPIVASAPPVIIFPVLRIFWR